MNPEKLIIEQLDVWTKAIETRSTTGRGSRSKLNLYGIKKLRELILDLAVRGQLVPQDPNDEPACVLLEKIAAEKEQLIKAGKIKKQKTLPPIGEDEKPFELPESWSWKRFGNITINRDGERKPVSASERKNMQGKYDYYGASGVIDQIDNYIFDKTLLLIGEDGANLINRSTPIAFIATGKYWVNNHAHVIDGISLGFLHYINLYINAISLEPYITGTAQPKMNQAKMNSILVAIPPEQEQHRIVAKVNELMSLCDALEQAQTQHIQAHQTLVEHLLAALTQAAKQGDFEQAWTRIAKHFDTLFTTEHSIDQLKQTLLQLAVMGKLVPQDPNDEPASVLLETIAAEKARLIKEKKIKKQKALPPISDEEKPFELPDGWAWCRIWDVVETITSGSRGWAKYYSDSGAIFLTMSNLSRNDYRLRMDTIRYVSPPKSGEGTRTKLIQNDLLISITGDVGNLGLIPEKFGEAYINQHTCMVRFMTKCRNLYFPELMKSPLAKDQFTAPQRGIKNSFRLSDIGEMIIPLPPLQEQEKIAKKINKFTTLCDQLKTRLAKQQTTQNQLADALKKL